VVVGSTAYGDIKNFGVFDQRSFYRARADVDSARNNEIAQAVDDHQAPFGIEGSHVFGVQPRVAGFGIGDESSFAGRSVVAVLAHYRCPPDQYLARVIGPVFLGDSNFDTGKGPTVEGTATPSLG
jgi:hypothetical protein